MATINYSRSLRLPSPHRSFERNLSYLVGYFVGTSFRVKKWCDSYESAILLCSSMNEQSFDIQFHVFEVRTEIFFVE